MGSIPQNTVALWEMKNVEQKIDDIFARICALPPAEKPAPLPKLPTPAAVPKSGPRTASLSARDTKVFGRVSYI